MNTGPKTMADVIRAELAETGLPQRTAARVLGIDERLMRRYCAPESDAPFHILMALRQLTQIVRNQNVIRLLEDGTLTASDGDVSRERLVEHNAKLLEAINLLTRRDALHAGIADMVDLSGGLAHVEPGDVIVDREGMEGVVQYMLDMTGAPKCVCRVKKWTDSSETSFYWRENVQFILPRCRLVSRAKDGSGSPSA